MAKGDWSSTATLRPAHIVITVNAPAAGEGAAYHANNSLGLMATVVAGSGGDLISRNFEIALTPDEETAAEALVQRILAQAVEEEGLAGLTPAPDAPEAQPAPAPDAQAAAPTAQ